jgi:N-acyl-D-amino-acid deacylase
LPVLCGFAMVTVGRVRGTRLEARKAIMKKHSLAVGLCLGLALILNCTGCGGGGGSTPEYKLPDTELPITGPTVAGTEQLDRNITALLKKWNVPGIAVAVVKDGKLIMAKGYGYSDLEAGRPMQPDDMFRIGSTSKMLTAVAVMQLVEQGKVDLDAKFLEVLPQYSVTAGGDPRLKLITIRMLLQHSGGWDRNVSGDPFSKQVEIAKELGVTAPAGCSDTIRYMMGKPLDFAPGTKWAYSNVGYCILGRIIEKVSGENYESYVRRHILDPAGIRGGYIGTTRQGRQRPHEVKYYDYPGAPLADSVFPGEGKVPLQYGGLELQDAPGGWIVSTVDLLRFMSALDGSRTLSPVSRATLKQMQENPGLPGIGPSIWYGFGLYVGPSPDRWFHGGSFPGAQTQLCHDSTGYSYAVMSNSRTNNPDAFAPEMEAAVVSGLASGFVGSTADLFPQFVSPDPPTQK